MLYCITNSAGCQGSVDTSLRPLFSPSSCGDMGELHSLLWGPKNICDYLSTWEIQGCCVRPGGDFNLHLPLWPQFPLHLNPALGSSAVLCPLTRPFLCILVLLNWLTTLGMGTGQCLWELGKLGSWGAPIHLEACFSISCYFLFFQIKLQKKAGWHLYPAFPRAFLIPIGRDCAQFRTYLVCY